MLTSGCSNDKLGMDVSAVPRDGLSHAELAMLAADIGTAVPLSPITIDSAEAKAVTDPQFIRSNGSSVHKCES